MYCYKCGQKLPESSAFCPYCGVGVRGSEAQTTDTVVKIASVRQSNSTPKTPKKAAKEHKHLPWKVAVAGALVLALLIAVGVLTVNGNTAANYATAGDFTAANEEIAPIRGLVQAVDPQLLELIEHGLTYEEGYYYKGYAGIVELAQQGYGRAAETAAVMQKDAYQKAIVLYEDQKYYVAEDLLALVGDYEESEQYQFYCQILTQADLGRNGTSAEQFEKLMELIEKPTAKQLIYDNQGLFLQYLEGEWSGSNEKYYLKVNSNMIEHNFPKNGKGKYINIRDRTIYTKEKVVTAVVFPEFRITIKNADSISVYSYKDGNTRDLSRK